MPVFRSSPGLIHTGDRRSCGLCARRLPSRCRAVAENALRSPSGSLRAFPATRSHPETTRPREEKVGTTERTTGGSILERCKGQFLSVDNTIGTTNAWPRKLLTAGPPGAVAPCSDAVRRLSSSHRCGEISARDVAAHRPDSPCSTGHDVARADCREMSRYEFSGRTGNFSPRRVPGRVPRPEVADEKSAKSTA